MRVKLKLVTACVWLGVMWCDKVRTMQSMLYLDVHETDEAPICSCGSYSRRAWPDFTIVRCLVALPPSSVAIDELLNITPITATNAL